MAKKKRSTPTDLDVTRITRTLYFFIAILALTIVVFDAGNLIQREAVSRRWILLTIALGANTTAWFLGGVNSLKKFVIFGLSLMFILVAGLLTYWERGMASSSTIFYIIPLLIVTSLKNRHALIATAIISAGTYALASVKYFNDFFNEGYRIQLWGSLLQYIGTIFIAAWLIMIITGLRRDSQ